MGERECVCVCEKEEAPDEHDAALGPPLLEVRQPLLVQLPRILHVR